MPDMEKLLDRQIRLFGTKIQEKLRKYRIIIVGHPNAIAQEIFKNFILLNVQEIITTKDILESTNKSIKKDILKTYTAVNINIKGIEQIRMQYLGQKRGRIQEWIDFFFSKKEDMKRTFCFLIDEVYTPECNFYFLCTKCQQMYLNKAEHECSFSKQQKSENVCLALAKDFYLGSVAVQEFIKIIKGKQHEALTFFSYENEP